MQRQIRQVGRQRAGDRPGLRAAQHQLRPDRRHIANLHPIPEEDVALQVSRNPHAAPRPCANQRALLVQIVEHNAIDDAPDGGGQDGRPACARRQVGDGIGRDAVEDRQPVAIGQLQAAFVAPVNQNDRLLRRPVFRRQIAEVLRRRAFSGEDRALLCL